jgi:hypothetical protein
MVDIFHYSHNLIVSGSEVQLLKDIAVEVFREKNIVLKVEGSYKHDNLTFFDFSFKIAGQNLGILMYGKDKPSNFIPKNNVTITSYGSLDSYKFLITECLNEIFQIYEDYRMTRNRKRLALLRVMHEGLGNFQVGSKDYLSMHIAELAGIRDNRPGSRLAGGRKKRSLKKRRS